MKNSKDLKILVAEDNGTYRKLLSAMIERLTGNAPQSATDGEEAISLTRKTAFDLIFMDNHMPKLSGIHATRQIRETLPLDRQPRIVAVSGSSNKKDLKQFEDAGMDDLLPKPFRLNELEKSIEDALMGKMA